MNTMINNESKTLKDFKNTVGCKGNIKSTTKGEDMVGKVFKSKKGFPKFRECESQLVRTGESLKVVSYNSEDNTYNLVNLDLGVNLDCHYAWFCVNDEELDYLLRRGYTK